MHRHGLERQHTQPQPLAESRQRCPREIEQVGRRMNLAPPEALNPGEYRSEVSGRQKDVTAGREKVHGAAQDGIKLNYRSEYGMSQLNSFKLQPNYIGKY